jgi:hypothetical protein
MSSRLEAQTMLVGLAFLLLAIGYAYAQTSSLPWRDVHSTLDGFTVEEAFQVSL